MNSDTALPIEELETADSDKVSAKVLATVASYLSESFSESKWARLSLEVERIIREAWRVQVSSEAKQTRENSRHFKHKAIELFGGHCKQCRNYNASVPCPTLDKHYPGCVNFKREEKHY